MYNVIEVIKMEWRNLALNIIVAVGLFAKINGISKDVEKIRKHITGSENEEINKDEILQRMRDGNKEG